MVSSRPILFICTQFEVFTVRDGEVNMSRGARIIRTITTQITSFQNHYQCNILGILRLS